MQEVRLLLPPFAINYQVKAVGVGIQDSLRGTDSAN